MLSTKAKIKLINWYPPYWGTGIKLNYISDDFRRFEVSMKLRWYNRNLIGTHFGGSLYAMCDPWYMFILILNLGKNYVAVDKAASIRYLRPGRGKLSCTFEISQEQIDQIKEETARVGKKDYSFRCEVMNEAGEVVCEVDKLLYVRKKDFDWDGGGNPEHG